MLAERVGASPCYIGTPPMEIPLPFKDGSMPQAVADALDAPTRPLYVLPTGKGWTRTSEHPKGHARTYYVILPDDRVILVKPD